MGTSARANASVGECRSGGAEASCPWLPLTTAALVAAGADGRASGEPASGATSGSLRATLEAGAASAAGDSAAGAWAASCCASAPSPDSSTRISLPLLTLSPTLTRISLTTPPCEDGTSMDALSDSRVMRLCSGVTVSPTETMISITSTSAVSPMSGTTTVTWPPAADAAGPAAGSAACCGALEAAGVSTAASALGSAADRDFSAASPASSSRMTEPSPTLSPTFILRDFTTPAAVDGISMEALSDSTVIRLCSLATLSPSATSTSMTSTSVTSPISGTLTSMMLLIVLAPLRRTADWLYPG